MPPPGEQLRRLPVPVRPASRETIGSFLNRLALANSLRIPHILALAGIRSSLRSFTPATDDTRGWSQSTPERIAILAGRPLASLTAAIPLLAAMAPAATAPLRACSRCMAAKSITGLVIIRARPGDYLCARHQQWLRGHQRPGLAVLPEISASQRRHDKHTRNVPDFDIALAHQRARTITAQWLDADWHPALTSSWHERNQRLTTTTSGPGTLYADVVTHPEMLAVARLLIAARQHPGISPGDIADRLGFRYPGRPHPLEPLQGGLSQLAADLASDHKGAWPGRALQAARGTEQRAGKPAQPKPRQLPGPEPGQLAELAITHFRRAADDTSLVNRGDIRSPVPVRITDLVVRAAEHVQQAHELNIDPDLLAGFPDR